MLAHHSQREITQSLEKKNKSKEKHAEAFKYLFISFSFSLSFSFSNFWFSSGVFLVLSRGQGLRHRFHGILEHGAENDKPDGYAIRRRPRKSSDSVGHET